MQSDLREDSESEHLVAAMLLLFLLGTVLLFVSTMWSIINLIVCEDPILHARALAGSLALRRCCMCIHLALIWCCAWTSATLPRAQRMRTVIPCRRSQHVHIRGCRGAPSALGGLNATCAPVERVAWCAAHCRSNTRACTTQAQHDLSGQPLTRSLLPWQVLWSSIESWFL